MLIKIDARQLGALLAGLRLLQAHAADGYESPEILDVFADGRAADPLKGAEVEALCDGLDGGGLVVDEADVSAIEAGWRDRVAVQGYVGERRQNLAVEFFTGAMTARHLAGMEAWCPPAWSVAMLCGEAIGEPGDG
ncbi:MAG: hypothetical protein EPN98_04245 [Phenylobacterium sp.]|uniref:hypothetical protein n=1 Tax=Phenylobacterium sp. TaxID=1871053 RepID=UPI00121D2525|nr:hypothetical protein [Phenylobacterium sp.]TAL36821.1 MAG: hypothetical protein EPN98_04245 [Phenylobacterium sp.]